MNHLYSDFGLALPVLMVAAGNVDDETRSVMKDLEKNPPEVESALETKNYSETAKALIPPYYKTQFVACKDIPEFLMLRDRLINEKFLYWLKQFTIFVIIDIELNPNYKEVRELFTNSFINPNDTVGWIYNRATEDLVNEHNETTHISFVSYRGDVKLMNIRQFIIPIALSGLVNKIWYQKYISLKDSPEITPTSSLGIYCPSAVQEDCLNILKELIKDIDVKSKETKPLLGSIYETLGIIKVNYPDLITAEDKQIFDKSYFNSPWGFDISIPQTNDAFNYFSYAAECYSKSQQYADKCADCAIRILSLPDGEFLFSSLPSVITNAKRCIRPEYRAWEIVYLMLRKKKSKKAILLAYQFSNIFSQISNDVNGNIDFKLKLIQMLYKETSSQCVMRDLCSPIILSLFNSSIEPNTIFNLIVKILSSVGTFLPVKLQKQMFNKLYDERIIPLKPSSQVNFDFGFVVENLRVIDSELTVRPINPQSTKTKSVFLYNNIKKTATSSTEPILIPIGFETRIAFDVYNPFAVELDVLLTIPLSQSFNHPATIKANSTTTVICEFVPESADTYIIDTVICKLHEARQQLSFNRKLTLKSIENAAVFAMRTDLPLSHPLEVFEGEYVQFSIWITNTGDQNIENMDLQFNGDIGAKFLPVKTPILPYESTSVTIGLQIQKSKTEISLVVCGQTTNVNVQSFIGIRQSLTILPSIEITGISPLMYQPDLDVDLAKVIFVAINLSNHSNTSFTYDIAFENYAELNAAELGGYLTNKIRHGVLSPQENSVFLVAILRDLLTNDMSSTTTEQQNRIMQAYKNYQEENKLVHLNNEQRLSIKRKVFIASFIEANLKFTWSCGLGRTGKLNSMTVLPSPDLLEELERQRPRTITKWRHAQTDIEDVPVDELVELHIILENVIAQKCELDLCEFLDPEAGVLWDGTLTLEAEKGAHQFVYPLYFTKPGKFVFKVIYETIKGIKGHIFITTKVI